MDMAAVLSLLAVAVAAAAIICVAIFNRRRQAQSTADEVHREPAESPKLDEEARQKEEAEGKAQEEEHVKTVEEGKRLEPGKRGGRPRGLTEAQKKQSAQEVKPRRPKPEIVCWKRGRHWVLAVEMPEEILENPGLTTLQDGSPLHQDESREAYWLLQQASGEIIVRWNEGEDIHEARVMLGQEDYLLFRLSGQNQNEGRRVRSPSFGSYLLMAPENWGRDEALSGPPSVAPEPVSLIGYQAYFFILEKGAKGKIAFCAPMGKSVVIESEASRFELIGTRLNDASEDMGPLFSERPPQIRALDCQAWEDIETIVVGREGRGKRKWRKSFSPVQERQEQDLPPEVAAKDGWYFLRFYDPNEDLVESLDFRFVSGLRNIKILQPSPFPSEGEHESAYVEFQHQLNCNIRPADDRARTIQIESKDTKTTLTVPADSIYDETRWYIGSEGKSRVQVVILVERLWWAISQENSPPSGWRDKLAILVCDDFTATSEKALWLRFPRRCWTDRILVGFERSRARPYVVKVTDKEIAIPLREFGECREVAERDRDHLLNIWIQRDRELVEGVVAIIRASLGPRLCVGCGRKKAAVATAVLRVGAGAIRVNGRPAKDYFTRAPLRAKQFLQRLLELPCVNQALSQMEVSIEVTGSSPGTVQQVKASTHALARALMKYDPQLKRPLREAGFGGVRVTKGTGAQ